MVQPLQTCSEQTQLHALMTSGTLFPHTVSRDAPIRKSWHACQSNGIRRGLQVHACACMQD